MYYQKYQKYKLKYLELKQIGGVHTVDILLANVKSLLDESTYKILEQEIRRIPDDFPPSRQYEMAYNLITEKAKEIKNQKLIDFLNTLNKH